jgi:hypothetical protein
MRKCQEPQAQGSPAGVVEGVWTVLVPVLRIPFHRELRAHAPGGACGLIFLGMTSAFAPQMPLHPLKLWILAQAGLPGQWGAKARFLPSHGASRLPGELHCIPK